MLADAYTRCHHDPWTGACPRTRWSRVDRRPGETVTYAEDIVVENKAAAPLSVVLRAPTSGLPGDEIVAIDGVRGSELTDSSARLLIRGEPNTRVTLGQQRTIVLVRAKAQDGQ